jgi:hypothetical protein
VLAFAAGRRRHRLDAVRQILDEVRLVMKIMMTLGVLVLTGCATVRCPPPVIKTVSVCTGQQTVIRVTDFLDDKRGKKVCPPIYVVTGQLCGR